MKWLWLISILTVLQFSASTASRAEQEMAWIGAGSASCAKFANYYKESPEVWESHFFTWAQGFMSGLNTAFIGSQRDANLTPKNLGIAEQQQRLRHYCDRSPLATYVSAVFDLYSVMREQQGLAPYADFDWGALRIKE